MGTNRLFGASIRRGSNEGKERGGAAVEVAGLMRSFGRLVLVACVVATALVVPAGGASGVTGPPNDPFWTRQLAYLGAIGLPEAWALSSGSSDLVVAVVDTGVDLDHPELAGRLLPGFDAVDDDDHPQDEHGHGTMVAGIIAAAADNGVGVAGILRSGSILPVRVMDALGKADTDDVAEGIRWAADHAADVITLSIGNYNRSDAVDAAIAHAIARDVVVVAAAGNHHDQRPTYPAADDGVLAVAAADATGRLAGFSNYGDWIDLAAPGIDIYTTGLAAGPEAVLRVGEGTSLAAPLVAGVAALARAVDPAASAATIAQRLRSSASDRGPHGTDHFYGAGLLDAAAALSHQSGVARLDWAPDGWEPNGTPGAAVVLTAGSRQSATITPEGDVDWYAVDVPGRSTLTFRIDPPTVGAGDGRAMDPTLSVHDPNLRLLHEAQKGWHGTAETLTVQVARPGRYWLRVGNDLPSRSPGPYTVSFTAGPWPPSFWYLNDNGASAISVPSAPSIGLADVDGDGHDEYLSANSSGLWVHHPGGEGLPKDGGSSVDLGPVTQPPRFVTVDVDGDDDIDVAVTTGTRIVLLQQSSGALKPPVPIGPAAQDLVIADLDGDGRLDVVYEEYDHVGWVRNTGTGWSSPRTVHAERLTSISVGDVTSDGRPDIVGVPNSNSREMVVLRAEPGDPSFSPQRHPLAVPVEDLALGDVTVDGRVDVVFTTNVRGGYDRGAVFVAAQAADSTLQAPRLVADRGRPTGPVVLTDIDADGRNDIIVAGTGGAGVVTGQADGTMSAEIFTAVRSSAAPDAIHGVAVGDVNGDGARDILVSVGETIRQAGTSTIPGPWLQSSEPAENQFDVAPSVDVRFHLTRRADPGSLDDTDVVLRNAMTGATIGAEARWDEADQTLVVDPQPPLGPGPWIVTVGGTLRDIGGAKPAERLTLRFTVGARPPIPAPPASLSPPPPPTPDPGIATADVAPRRAGYWMADGAGNVYAFGAAEWRGTPVPRTGVRLADLEPAPDGKGYWTVDEHGTVNAFGAPHLGDAELTPSEVVTSLSATPTGRGYWIFTTTGRVLPFGDAGFFGDMSAVKLNGPVLDSIPTPTGDGYYMVASDGGIFAFDAAFRGSMGATKLNKPVVGMVRYGDAYLMVGADGGIFNFSNLPFAGSLGGTPPATPVVAVAALPPA